MPGTHACGKILLGKHIKNDFWRASKQRVLTGDVAGMGARDGTWGARDGTCALFT